MKLLYLLICLMLIKESTGQKIMNLDSTLKANSKALPVQIKADIMVGDIMKYRFGQHKVVSSKTGFGSGTTSSKWFSNIETSESKNKASFVLVSNEKDTLKVLISIDSKSKEVRNKYLSFRKGAVSIEREEDPSKIESTKTIAALITAQGERTEWSLIYISRMNTDSSQIPQKYGILTDSITVIEIGEVANWTNGRSTNLYLTKGFEFYRDGRAIAAVQCPFNTLQKKFVWIRNDLDHKIKNVLAAAAVILMSYNVQ